MQIYELLHHLRIDYVTEGHKHCRQGWVNMECPFCTGNPGYHLGYSIEEDYFHCWRCGGHAIIPTVSKLSNLSARQASELIHQFGGKTRATIRRREPEVRVQAFRFPSGTGPMTVVHRQYLRNRGFDAERLEYEWGIQGTGPVAMLDDSDYKHRIIIPITWERRVVSFQGRTIADVNPKYKACPKARELVHHQEILYGRQDKWGETGICVEGVTDVWKLGYKAFAVFGISYTKSQVLQIKRHFKRVAVAFDDDPQAVKQADKLIAELKVAGVWAWRISIAGDPGEMSYEEAKRLVEGIL